MMIKEKIKDKENIIRNLIEKLKVNLNNESIHFQENPNSWSYITSLSHTENKLKELLEYFEAAP